MKGDDGSDEMTCLRDEHIDSKISRNYTNKRTEVKQKIISRRRPWVIIYVVFLPPKNVCS